MHANLLPLHTSPNSNESLNSTRLRSSAQPGFQPRSATLTSSSSSATRARPNPDSLFFASRGANVVLNDLSKQAADAAVQEINQLGKGKAVANYDSAVAGDKIISQAISTFGAVHVSKLATHSIEMMSS